MKTTVNLNGEKLLRVMKLAGLKTRREAIEFALTEAERVAKMRKLFEKPWTVEDLKDAVDPRYDIVALRKKEKPR